MDLLFILRDAQASSLLGTMRVATEAQRAGKQVAVLFTGEALAALTGGVFLWPTGLQGQELRLTMADQGRAMGLPLLGRGEGRQLHATASIEEARQAGVRLLACPLWTALLNAEGRLPQGVVRVEMGELLQMLERARQVIGSF